MRNALIVGGVIIVAVFIGVLIFIYGDDYFSNNSFLAVANNNSPAVEVQFTKIARGDISTIEERVNYFITSETQLNELWKMVDATSTPPKIDFEKEAVIAVFAGQKPTTGYEIRVSKVEDSEIRNVSLTLEEPDSRCIESQIIIAPYEIVTVSATSLPLGHEDQIATIDCED